MKLSGNGHSAKGELLRKSQQRDAFSIRETQPQGGTCGGDDFLDHGNDSHDDEGGRDGEIGPTHLYEVRETVDKLDDSEQGGDETENQEGVDITGG